MSLTADTTLYADVESNPDVGSSRNSSAGSAIISTPIETRFLSPPDTPLRFSSPMNVFAAFSSPKRDSNDCTFSFFSLRLMEGGSRRRAANNSVS